MTSKPGGRAIVVGAGMGGLAAAAALSGYFRETLVLDQDYLPEEAAERKGAGQDAHTHQLLKAGELALEKLLPGLTQDFVSAGAVQMRVGRDVKVFDFGGWMAPCDAGFSVTSLSRPAYEAVLRQRVRQLPGVTIRSEANVRRFVVLAGACVGIELENGATLDADLCIDASGMNARLLGQLAEDGHTRFETEEVRINVAYSTARFRKAAEHVSEHTGIFFLPGPPGKQFGLLLPIEDNQWILSVGARGGDQPPRTLDDMRAYARAFDTDLYDRIKTAELAGKIKTFRKPSAIRRKLWEAPQWPEHLIPLGDMMSSVNPTYGQGMTVAACQAERLCSMLSARAADQSGLDGLVKDYLPVAAEIAARAWSLSINSDYVYPETEGERPPAFAMLRAMASTLRKLSDEDLDFRVARYRLVHMVDEAKTLQEGPLAIRFFSALQGTLAD